MEFGRLNKRIAIQSKTEARDAIGGITRTWATAATRWGRIEPLSGREFLYAQQVEAMVTHRVTLRYYDGLKPDMRLLYGTRVFQIESILNPDEIGAEMVLLCSETYEPS